MTSRLEPGGRVSLPGARSAVQVLSEPHSVASSLVRRSAGGRRGHGEQGARAQLPSRPLRSDPASGAHPPPALLALPGKVILAQVGGLQLEVGEVGAGGAGRRQGQTRRSLVVERTGRGSRVMPRREHWLGPLWP